MSKPLFFFLLMTVLFAGCNENRIYSESSTLSDNYEWVKSDNRVFKFEIIDTVPSYSLTMSFRYAYGYPYKELKVQAVRTDPKGKQSTARYSLSVRDEDGKYVGDAAGDIWDSEHLVIPEIKFNLPGVYKYEVTHDMPVKNVVFAMEIGMIVAKLEN